MPEHHFPTRVILTSLLVLVGACSGSESPAAPPTVASILITPQLATLTSEGATQQFLAQPLDQDGGSVVGVTVKWSSSNSSVVEIDETIGLATAVAEGNVTVTAESGTAYGQASVSVDIPECTAPVTVTLVPGQTLVTDPPASATCALRLPSGNAGDRYRVAIVRLSAAQDSAVVTASLTLTPRGGVITRAARLRASASAPPPLLNLQQMALLESSARVAEATSRAHERLRASEEDMLRRLGPPATPRFPIARATAGPFPVSPARKSFIASSSGKCSLEGKTPITGLLVAQSPTIAVYQDSVQAQFQKVLVDNVEDMLDFFTAFGQSTIEAYFGAVPDRDSNGQVVVLVTPVVTGNVAAFVWGGDQLDTSDCAASNQMELVYFSAAHINSITEGNYQALETLVHEIKHLVSFNHRIIGSVLDPHPKWMEEGTAEVAAEITSRKAWAAAGGPPQNGIVTRESFPTSGTKTTPENYGVYLRLVRSRSYLSTHPNSLVNGPPTGTYFIYGSGWHFHRFLGDSYGAASSSPGADAPLFAEQNSSATPSGLPGLLTLTGKPIETLLAEYAAAVMLNGTEAPLPAMGFTTYDFPSAMTVLPKATFVSYPYPVTVTGTATDPSASFAPGGIWSGPIGNAGLRIHDFVSNGTGDGADVTVQVEGAAKIVVVRLH